METETKVCRLCMEEKPLSEFHVGKREYRRKRTGEKYAVVSYLRNECIPCYTDYQKWCRMKSRIKVRLKRQLQEAKFLAVMRLLKEHPEWAQEIALRSPDLYKKFLREEEEKIVTSQIFRSMKYGYRNKERNLPDILDAYHAALDSLNMEWVKPLFNKRLGEQALKSKKDPLKRTA